MRGLSPPCQTHRRLRRLVWVTLQAALLPALALWGQGRRRRRLRGRRQSRAAITRHPHRHLAPWYRRRLVRRLRKREPLPSARLPLLLLLLPPLLLLLLRLPLLQLPPPPLLLLLLLPLLLQLLLLLLPLFRK